MIDAYALSTIHDHLEFVKTNGAVLSQNLGNVVNADIHRPPPGHDAIEPRFRPGMGMPIQLPITLVRPFPYSHRIMANHNTLSAAVPNHVQVICS